uniref:Calcineurin-like phosphoesterase domain-containing protein n=1 Tax=viral metagenome TaxID=1070528 RepID=A0A6C0B3W0_9ZZZZ
MSKNYWSIILSSDLHFGYLDYLKDVGIRLDKIDHVHKIIQMKDEYNVQMVITAGDLTENGLDGRSILCWRKNTHDELTPMIDKWVTPLENAGIDVLLTIGNHDTYTGQPYVYKPVFEYIKKKYNATCYPLVYMEHSGCYTQKTNNILFISLGIYPKNLKFLKKNLPKDKNDAIIIFYHYNTVDEAYSDWWSDEEKEKFYEVIKDYNILAIINGHIHLSYKKKWKGFTMLNGGGSKLIRMNMEDNKYISEDFI